MSEYLPYLFLLIPALLIASFVAVRRRNSKEAEERWSKEEKDVEITFENGKVVKTEKEQVDDSDNSFVFVRYRGEVITMRKFEKREYWDNYNRTQRNEHLEGLKKALKRGEVKREWLDEDKTLCCYIPVKGNLKKVLEDYKEFNRLGGAIEDIS
jgi:hypothetical protein